MLGDHLDWRVGDGPNIEIGVDAILGCGKIVFKTRTGHRVGQLSTQTGLISTT
jgi:hypothetical protein